MSILSSIEDFVGGNGEPIYSPGLFDGESAFRPALYFELAHKVNAAFFEFTERHEHQPLLLQRMQTISHISYWKKPEGFGLTSCLSDFFL